MDHLGHLVAPRSPDLESDLAILGPAGSQNGSKSLSNIYLFWVLCWNRFSIILGSILGSLSMSFWGTNRIANLFFSGRVLRKGLESVLGSLVFFARVDVPNSLQQT